MKLLLDTCVSPRTRDGLASAGHDRLVDMPIRKQTLFLLRTLGHYSEDLLRGALITVEPGRVRLRPPVADLPSDTDV